MNIEAHNTEAEDVIESSQVPTLRKNVRKCKIFYGETSSPKPSDAKRRKKCPAKKRNKPTVSQCMLQEWKNPRIGKRAQPRTKESNTAPRTQCDVEEYQKFTQQDVAQGHDWVPSVSLFEQQQDVIHQYTLHETSEAQQEDTLDRMLQGFRTSYEQATARIMAASAVTNTSHLSVDMFENVPNAAPNEANLYEPLVQITEPPRETRVERDEVQPMVIDGCIDLSTRRDKPSTDNAYCARNEIIQKRQHVLNNYLNERMYAKNNYDILDLHMTPCSAEQRSKREHVSKCCQQQQQPKQIEQSSYKATMNVSTAEHATQTGPKRFRNAGIQHMTPSSGEQQSNVSKCCQQQQQPKQIEQSSYKATMSVSTAEHATQTRPKRFRNAGIQHRSVASFDMSKYNVITLARMFGSDPDSVYCNLKDIMATPYPRTLWHSRNLSQVFSQDDPYYANLQYFINPSH